MGRIDWSALPQSPGMRRGFTRAAVSADRMSAIRVTVSSDADFGDPTHWHENEQMLIVVSGSAVVQIDDAQHEVGVGDLVFYPAGSRHGLLSIGSAGCTLYEVFAPPRLDQLPGWIGESPLRFD
jgi:mannose-6-phosphate isomerase-like protein (cupin superfamily)